jgi:hypothetical protein
MNAEESRVMAAVVDALEKARAELSYCIAQMNAKRHGSLWFARDSCADALAQVAALQREGDGKSAKGAQSELPEVTPPLPAPFVAPIARDEEYRRTYIPLPGGWEVQTKGRGSSFRIAAPSGHRLNIPDSPYLHETIERMARGIHAECERFAHFPKDPT